MLKTTIVENIKTHSLFSVTPTPVPINRAVYEIMWENVVQPERTRLTVQECAT